MRRNDSRPRGGESRRGDTSSRRRFEERPRSRAAARSRRKSSSSHSRSPRRKGGGSRQSGNLQDDLKQLVKRTADQPMAPAQRAPPMNQPPLNPYVEQFIAVHQIERPVAVRLRGLLPEQQGQVMSTSLAGARDPTTVVLMRIRKVEAGGAYFVPHSAAMAANAAMAAQSQITHGTTALQQHQQQAQQSTTTGSMSADVAERARSMGYQVARPLHSDGRVDDKAHLGGRLNAAQMGHGRQSQSNQPSESRGEGSRNGERGPQTVETSEAARDSNAKAEEDDPHLASMREKMQSTMSAFNGKLTATEGDSTVQGNSKVASVPYHRPFASKTQTAPAAKQEAAPEEVPQEDPTAIKQRESYNLAQDLLKAAVSRTSGRSAAPGSQAPKGQPQSELAKRKMQIKLEPRQDLVQLLKDQEAQILKEVEESQAAAARQASLLQDRMQEASQQAAAKQASDGRREQEEQTVIEQQRDIIAQLHQQIRDMKEAQAQKDVKPPSDLPPPEPRAQSQARKQDRKDDNSFAARERASDNPASNASVSGTSSRATPQDNRIAFPITSDPHALAKTNPKGKPDWLLPMAREKAAPQEEENTAEGHSPNIALQSGNILALLAAQHQQQQQELAKTAPRLAATMLPLHVENPAVPEIAEIPAWPELQDQPSSSTLLPAQDETPQYSETEKAYLEAWFEHQKQAQSDLFDKEQALVNADPWKGTEWGDDWEGWSSKKKKGKKSKQPMMPGDWECPKCGDHQFQRNLACRNCGVLRRAVMDHL